MNLEEVNEISQLALTPDDEGYLMHMESCECGDWDPWCDEDVESLVEQGEAKEGDQWVSRWTGTEIRLEDGKVVIDEVSVDLEGDLDHHDSYPYEEHEARAEKRLKECAAAVRKYHEYVLKTGLDPLGEFYVQDHTEHRVVYGLTYVKANGKPVLETASIYGLDPQEDRTIIFDLASEVDLLDDFDRFVLDLTDMGWEDLCLAFDRDPLSTKISAPFETNKRIPVDPDWLREERKLHAQRALDSNKRTQ